MCSLIIESVPASVSLLKPKECVLFTLECVLVFSLLEDAVYGHIQADLREDV